MSAATEISLDIFDARIRARTVSIKRLSKRALNAGTVEYPPTEREAPTKRSECAGGYRPCPFVSCAYHLALDVDTRTGAIKLNFPDIEVEDMEESCSLDVADRGGITLEEVASVTNLTRERVRQIETIVFAKLHKPMRALDLFEDEACEDNMHSSSKYPTPKANALARRLERHR